MTQSTRKAQPPPDRRAINGIQVMFAAILAIALILTINFSSRIADNRAFQEVYARVQTEIDNLGVEQERLTALRDYSMGDAYVEAWANAEGKMVRPGEVLVIPVPMGNSIENAPTASVDLAEVRTAPDEIAPWQVWWALFFDNPPPDLR